MGHRILHGFTTVFAALDDRIADVIEDGINRKGYFVRVKVPPVENPSGELVAPPRERYLPLGEAPHTSIVRFARDRLRPTAAPDDAPPQAARSRAELHAAIVHQPDGRPTGPTLSM